MPAISPTASAALPPPPSSFLSDAALFLDFDGTLVELVDRPDQVRADPELADLLARLVAAIPGRVAIISGRSVQQLDAMLGSAAQGLALAGSHGAELRPSDQQHVAAAVPEALDSVIGAMTRFTAVRPGTMTEVKTLGAAIHYRLAPDQEGAATALAERLAAEHGLTLQRGKMMVEVRSDGDKGRAVELLLAEGAMAGRSPLVLGDDLTDEDAFRAAAARGGAGVLVGDPRETAATYWLSDVAAVRRWLAEAIA